MNIREIFRNELECNTRQKKRKNYRQIAGEALSLNKRPGMDCRAFRASDDIVVKFANSDMLNGDEIWITQLRSLEQREMLAVKY